MGLTPNVSIIPELTIDIENNTGVATNNSVLRKDKRTALITIVSHE